VLPVALPIGPRTAFMTTQSERSAQVIRRQDATVYSGPTCPPIPIERDRLFRAIIVLGALIFLALIALS